MSTYVFVLLLVLSRLVLGYLLLRGLFGRVSLRLTLGYKALQLLVVAVPPVLLHLQHRYYCSI